MFKARIDELVFAGFNLSSTEAKGCIINAANSGWFFVVEESAGESVFKADRFTGVKNSTSLAGIGDF